MPDEKRIVWDPTDPDTGTADIPDSSYWDMTQWPGTLSKARMEPLLHCLRDLRRGNQPNAEEMEFQQMADWMGMMWAEHASNFGRRAAEMMEARIPEDEAPERNWAEMVKIVREADTPHTIGGMIVLPDPEGPEGPGQTEARTVFQIPRHPEWMGTYRGYPLMSGMRVLVFESERRPEQPGVILAEPVDAPRMFVREEPFPDGEAELLRMILTWHGAKECRWIPLAQ